MHQSVDHFFPLVPRTPSVFHRNMGEKSRCVMTANPLRVADLDAVLHPFVCETSRQAMGSSLSFSNGQ